MRKTFSEITIQILLFTTLLLSIADLYTDGLISFYIPIQFCFLACFAIFSLVNIGYLKNRINSLIDKRSYLQTITFVVFIFSSSYIFILQIVRFLYPDTAKSHLIVEIFLKMDRLAFLLFAFSVVILLARQIRDYKFDKVEDINIKFSKLDLVALVFLSIFAYFGILHLGSFVTVDEPKWLYVRVEQLLSAFTGTWNNGFINDKPGVVPSILASLSHLVSTPYGKNYNEIENFLFYWRLPIVIFNTLTLYANFKSLEALYSKRIAIFVLVSIASFPIFIGISQIVNPDSLLWNLGLLFFLQMNLLFKTQQKVYIISAGLVLGLAFATKYFVAVLLFTVIIASYLEIFSKEDFRFEDAQKRFIKKLTYISIVLVIAIIIYGLLFPATWSNPFLLFTGTLFSELIRQGGVFFFPLIFLIILDSLILNFKFSLYFKVHFKNFKFNFTLQFIFFAILTLLLLNLFIFKSFDLNTFIYSSYVRGATSVVELSITGLYSLFLSIPIFSLILFIYIVFKNKNILLKNEFLVLFILIFLFIFGASVGGYYASPRYLVLVYPFIFLSVAVGLNLNLLKKSKFVALLLFISTTSLLELLHVNPFYLTFTNVLNTEEYVVFESWGYGGYEAAQYLNASTQISPIVWVDREGFEEFYKGDTIWRNNVKSVEDLYSRADYVLLSFGGQNVFQTRTLVYYEDKEIEKFYDHVYLDLYKNAEFEFEICFGKFDCSRLIKLDKSYLDSRTVL